MWFVFFGNADDLNRCFFVKTRSTHMELNWTESFCFLRNGRPNFKPFHFLEIFCVAMEVSRVKFIPHFEHQKPPFRSLYSTCHYLWGILIPIRGEDWEGYFWIGEWYMAKLNDCFFRYMTLILMKCGVKFWVGFLSLCQNNLWKSWI